MLTEAALQDIKLPPGKQQLKVFDRGGVKSLYLLVRPAARAWRLKFRYGGVENLVSLGQWPEVSLVEARQKAQTMREQLAKGIDPRVLGRAWRAEREEATRQRKQERRRDYRKTPRGKTPTPAHSMPRVCEACGKPLSGGRFNLSRDHCHATGAARGWLCDKCNRALGMLGDDLEGVEQVRQYLLKYSQFSWLYVAPGPQLNQHGNSC
jgi:Recombination endonuclease VII/Arm DNA-binding domain